MSAPATLVIERSHLRVRAVVLRDRLTGETVNSKNSTGAAIRYCQRHGYRYTLPMHRLDELLTQNGL